MRQKMVKVRMLVCTAYQGPRKEGDEIFVPEDFAHRWVKNGIAEFVEVEGNQDEQVVEGNEDVQESQGEEETVEEQEEVKELVVDESNYDALTAKELYEICKEQGLDVEPKKSKAYYIEKLEAEAAEANTEE